MKIKKVVTLKIKFLLLLRSFRTSCFSLYVFTFEFSCMALENQEKQRTVFRNPIKDINRVVSFSKLDILIATC